MKACTQKFLEAHTSTGKAKPGFSLPWVKRHDSRKLCEFIQEETGEKDLMIRDAEIFPHFSFVTVPFAQAEALLRDLQKTKREVENLL